MGRARARMWGGPVGRPREPPEQTGSPDVGGCASGLPGFRGGPAEEDRRPGTGERPVRGVQTCRPLLLSQAIGFIAEPSAVRTSMWRWVPVTLPVAPMRPIV